MMLARLKIESILVSLRKNFILKSACHPFTYVPRLQKSKNKTRRGQARIVSDSTCFYRPQRHSYLVPTQFPLGMTLAQLRPHFSKSVFDHLTKTNSSAKG